MSEILNSDWAKEQTSLLLSPDKSKREQVKNQYFHKLQYVMNLTKIKINIPELTRKLEAERQPKNDTRSTASQQNCSLDFLLNNGQKNMSINSQNNNIDH